MRSPRLHGAEDRIISGRRLLSAETLRILITGGSGFLGSALARHFQGLGHSVALLLRPDSQLSRFNGCDINAFRIGRCTNDAEITQFIQDVQPQIIVHAACAYGRQGERLIDVVDTNLHLGLFLLEATKSIRQPVTFINTGTVLESTVSDYALSKHQFVAWGKRFTSASDGKLQFINVLLQHMYGPGDGSSKFTTHVLKTCSANNPTLNLTAGEQHRDFVYIADVVSAYATIVQQRHALNTVQEIELGSGEAPSVREFVETVHQLTNSATKLRFGAIPYRPNEAMLCKADISKLKEMGWSPKYSLVSGLKETIGLGI